MSTDLRIAGAPISWGVCEVPGWGVQLPRTRVLEEMRQLGLSATELGPDGFLPADPAELRALLESFGLQLAAGFVTAALSADDQGAVLESVRRQAQTLGGAGADVLVLAVVSAEDGYDERAELSAAQWDHVLQGVDKVQTIARECGLACALHPHMGTLVERAEDIDMIGANSDVAWCLDTGHLLVGGVEPVAFTQGNAHRIAHVHLKDVRRTVAESVARGEMTYADAVSGGLYAPLGEGDIDMRSIVESLEQTGYSGWYVLEQDVRLDAEAEDPATNARRSVAAVAALTAAGSAR
jgi:inosose dehydratase